MGVGLAQACRYHGMRLICVVDTRAHEHERAGDARAGRRRARRLASRIRETGDLLVARLALVAAAAAPRSPNSFWPDQYANESNPAAHAAGTMREIDEALDGQLDYLFVATSTTGTLRGCGDYLREHGRSTRVVAVDSIGSALFGGRRGARRLPGFGAGVETDSVRRRRIRRARARLRPRLRRRLPAARRARGDPRGRLLGRRRVRRSRRSPPQMEPGSRCAAIFADGGTGYLETVYDDAWVERELGCDRRRELAALVAEGELASMPGAPVVRRVAIVGLGPKGLFALERLLDHARDLPPRTRLEIDVFEPHAAPGRRTRSTTRISRSTCA